ncbi:MAG: hypothetical protein IJ689_05285 [Alphaproteobacteria bacterium]|nr:hypothetical protein [Alphaproteobacteria bacterium]
MDDDIFAQSENKEEKEDSNMDWKKSGIDKHERLTLKVNVKQANMYNADKKRNPKSKNKLKAPPPQGFKKISKKIRDAYDDEDEEDGEYILIPVFADKEVSSLEKALTPQELKILDQLERGEIEDVPVRQAVERDMKIQEATRIVKQSGLEVNRKVAEQLKYGVKEITPKDLAVESLKNKKDKTIEPPSIKEIVEPKPEIKELKEEKPVKPAKELPKIKDAQEKEVRKAVMDDAEKDKQSAKKVIEKQREEKEEVNAVTKENTKETKIYQEPQKETPEPQAAKKEEQLPAEEKQNLSEKAARDIILEKSGRTNKEAKETPQEQEKKPREEAQEASREDTRQTPREREREEEEKRRQQIYIQSSSRSR